MAEEFLVARDINGQVWVCFDRNVNAKHDYIVQDLEPWFVDALRFTLKSLCDEANQARQECDRNLQRVDELANELTKAVKDTIAAEKREQKAMEQRDTAFALRNKAVNDLEVFESESNIRIAELECEVSRLNAKLNHSPRA